MTENIFLRESISVHHFDKKHFILMALAKNKITEAKKNYSFTQSMCAKSNVSWMIDAKKKTFLFLPFRVSSLLFFFW